MLAIVQRVTKATVVYEKSQNSIDKGYLVLLGIVDTDTKEDAIKLAKKLVNLRIMADSEGKMNLSLSDTQGSLLIISQFTLISDATRGFRPSFIHAAKPDIAKLLFDLVVDLCSQSLITTKTGFFGEYMSVELVNDGPTTIVLDSQKL